MLAAVCTLHLAVLGCLLGTACSIEVITSKELEAINGTDTRLKCTFSSSAPVGDNVIIAWMFRPISGGDDQTIFYYHKNPYPPTDGHFQGRAVWDGNIMRNDASIVIRNIQSTDNGTYLCQVKNPPDVHVEMGEIQVRVVNKGMHQGGYEEKFLFDQCFFNFDTTTLLWSVFFFLQTYMISLLERNPFIRKKSCPCNTFSEEEAEGLKPSLAFSCQPSMYHGTFPNKHCTT
ncbi:hypothetical protein XENTR_v10018764 [Xenopus tropicalis]|nr:hypothetical protein XENTR_v10018764 [Xenopus tropicalis]